MEDIEPKNDLSGLSSMTTFHSCNESWSLLLGSGSGLARASSAFSGSDPAWPCVLTYRSGNELLVLRLQWPFPCPLLQHLQRFSLFPDAHSKLIFLSYESGDQIITFFLGQILVDASSSSLTSWKVVELFTALCFRGVFRFVIAEDRRRPGGSRRYSEIGVVDKGRGGSLASLELADTVVQSLNEHDGAWNTAEAENAQRSWYNSRLSTDIVKDGVL
ncbi:hypothetical protein Tco_0939210 [Tanacetum coccineum]|uniref:Uncharacterized protein n=1 Tax=Tanacetum coccineum TaxID=301880 RepID=A0ABQ5DJF5_9ASTR